MEAAALRADALVAPTVFGTPIDVEALSSAVRQQCKVMEPGVKAVMPRIIEHMLVEEFEVVSCALDDLQALSSWQRALQAAQQDCIKKETPLRPPVQDFEVVSCALDDFQALSSWKRALHAAQQDGIKKEQSLRPAIQEFEAVSNALDDFQALNSLKRAVKAAQKHSTEMGLPKEQDDDNTVYSSSSSASTSCPQDGKVDDPEGKDGDDSWTSSMSPRLGRNLSGDVPMRQDNSESSRPFGLLVDDHLSKLERQVQSAVCRWKNHFARQLQERQG